MAAFLVVTSTVNNVYTPSNMNAIQSCMYSMHYVNIRTRTLLLQRTYILQYIGVYALDGLPSMS